MWFLKPFPQPFPKWLRHATASPMDRNRFVAIAMPKTLKSTHCNGASDKGWMCHHIRPECHALLIAQWNSCHPHLPFSTPVIAPVS
jgi:hypothetical protein